MLNHQFLSAIGKGDMYSRTDGSFTKAVSNLFLTA